MAQPSGRNPGRRLPEAEERRLVEALVTLGLAPPFTLDDAKDRFRNLAKIYHPDAGRNADADAFRRATEALATIETHIGLCCQQELRLGHSGSSASSMAANLVEQLADAEARLVEKDGEIGQMRLEAELQARQAARGKGHGMTWLIPAYLVILVVAVVVTVALVGRSETVVPLVLPTFPIASTPVRVKDNNALFASLINANAEFQATSAPPKIRIRGGRAEFLGPLPCLTYMTTEGIALTGKAKVSSFPEIQAFFQDDGIVLSGRAQIHPFPELKAVFNNDRSGLVLEGRAQLPPFAANVWNTRLDDVYDTNGNFKTRWGWLREAVVTIPRFVVDFAANGAKPSVPEGKATIGGWIESQLCDGPSPLKRKTPSGKSDSERFRPPDNVTPLDFLSPTPSSMDYYRQLTKTE